jgi:hypothetical protein
MSAFIFGSALELVTGLTSMLAMSAAMVLSNIRGVNNDA